MSDHSLYIFIEPRTTTICHDQRMIWSWTRHLAPSPLQSTRPSSEIRLPWKRQVRHVLKDGSGAVQKYNAQCAHEKWPPITYFFFLWTLFFCKFILFLRFGLLLFLGLNFCDYLSRSVTLSEFLRLFFSATFSLTFYYVSCMCDFSFCDSFVTFSFCFFVTCPFWCDVFFLWLSLLSFLSL